MDEYHGEIYRAPLNLVRYSVNSLESHYADWYIYRHRVRTKVLCD